MVVRLLEKSELNSDKSPRMRPSSASESDHEAKRWKGYVDTLKRTVNSMHDICLAKQNVLGCEVLRQMNFINIIIPGSFDVPVERRA